MAETAHTPGPWRDRYLPQHLNRITAADGFVTICDIALWQVDYSGQQTNARRIARVPELEAEVMRLRRMLIEARQWNWIDFDEADEDERECLTEMTFLDREISEAVSLNGGTDDT